MVKSYNIVKYECSFCENLYNTEQEAISCEKKAEKIKFYSQTLQPWNWYILQHDKSSSYDRVFVGKVECTSDWGEDKPYCQLHIRLYDYLWNEYYVIPGARKIVEILTPREAYRRQGLLINFMQYNCMGQLNKLRPRYKMPVEIAREIDLVIQEAKNDKIKTKLKNNTKEQLAEQLLLHENTIFDSNFSFEALANKVK